MILFWAICALMILVALVFVLPAALKNTETPDLETEDERKKANIAVYRDQLTELEADLRNGIVAEDQYAQDRQEIQRRLLEDTAASQPQKATGTSISARNTAYLVGLGLPLVAIILYINVGNPKSMSDNPPPTMPTTSSSAPAQPPAERSQEQIQANVEKLAKRLESNPSDAQGWTMLARSYSSMEKYAEAANAYAKLTELKPNDADLWAEYAFATAMANGRSLNGKPTELINRALKVDPENAKALQLAGSAAFEARDYKKAVDYWQRVLKRVPANSEAAQTINERINEARQLATGGSK